jgi:hypothetical protein
MQRILQEHVGGGKFVNDVEIAGLTPEIPKLAAYDSLVVFLFGHDVIPLLFVVCSRGELPHCPPNLPSIRFGTLCFLR